MFVPFQPKTTNPVKPAIYILSLASLVMLTVVFILSRALPVQAQIPGGFFGVDGFITSTTAPATLNFPTTPYATPCDPGTFPGCLGSTTNQTYGSAPDGNLVLDGVVVGGVTYEPARDLLPPQGLADRLVFRRAGAGLPERALLFFQYETAAGAPTNVLELTPERALSLEEAMLSRIINRGIDNVFNNATPGAQETRNNIQRVDYLVLGAVPPFNGLDLTTLDRATTGFLVLERGGNDPFQIAAITAVDAAGNPTAYGPLIEVPASAWGSSGATPIVSAVLRLDDLVAPIDPATAVFNPSHLVPAQSIQGIVFPINSLVDDSVGVIFGYSLFAGDVPVGANLVDFASFPTTTNGTTQGGLDLVAGGFGLVRQVAQPVSDFSLVKRITNLIGPATLPDFTQVLGTTPAENQLRTAGLGQGLITVTDPTVDSDNVVEYTIYLSNVAAGDATGVIICDQIPAATTFVPDSFGTGQGIQAIASSNPPGPVVNYTNADDGDPGTFFPPGTPLPAACGPDQGNGAVVVNVGTVGGDQVGLIRFRTEVN